MVNSTIDNTKQEIRLNMHPSIYNIRACPQCGSVIFGMPGGRDAHCNECGHKDPCCSD